MSRRLKFIGVNSTGSAVRKVFPSWMELLGQDVELETVDIPLGSTPEAFRAAIEAIRDDASVIGATVTAHKTAIFETSADLFTHTSALAERLGEISVIVPEKNGLAGAVIEQGSVARTLVELGENGRALTSDDAHLVIYGAGGTASSLIACLGDAAWPDGSRPSRLHVIDTDPARLDHARHLASSGAVPLAIETHLTTGTHDLGLLGSLPPRSVIINATGLGKDRPGSPLQHPAPWPQQAQVWDLNYRGDLVFLDDARAADPALNLRTLDGWELFINGWAEGLSMIFGQPIDSKLRQQMSVVAAQVSR